MGSSIMTCQKCIEHYTQRLRAKICTFVLIGENIKINDSGEGRGHTWRCEWLTPQVCPWPSPYGFFMAFLNDLRLLTSILLTFLTSVNSEILSYSDIFELGKICVITS